MSTGESSTAREQPGATYTVERSKPGIPISGRRRPMRDWFAHVHLPGGPSLKIGEGYRTKREAQAACDRHAQQGGSSCLT